MPPPRPPPPPPAPSSSSPQSSSQESAQGSQGAGSGARDTAPALPTAYSPPSFEPRITQRWLSSGAFHADPARVAGAAAAPFSILIPPPNVTAGLHLGHALNNSLQDVLIRAHRMMGFETMWMPGTDHAGIATQTVVEKRVLAEEGRRRSDFKGEEGRREFVAKIQALKDEYEATITDQLKALGCSCDWERQRFTMDDVCAAAVREAFFRLFKEGLIYRGKRLVNWDPATQTALADDEVEMEEVDGFFYYMRYPLVHPPTNPTDPHDAQEVTWSELAARGYPGADRFEEDEQAYVTVATTRPETYLGDTAVAINPTDPRAGALRGLMVQLPLVGRIIPIVEDDYVVMPDADSIDAKARYATGFLKVTPAHDPNDYEIGRRHDLAVINVMAPDASISDQHGWDNRDEVRGAHVFLHKSREEARTLVVREFDARGLLEKKTPYRHSVGHSYRSHVPVEPYLSDQWYVRVTDDRLRGEAQAAVAREQRTTSTFSPREGHAGDGSIRFFPERYSRTYESWHDSLRDWCISRQLWWGHRIPVWSKNVVQAEHPNFFEDSVQRLLLAGPDSQTPYEGLPTDRVWVQRRYDPSTRVLTEHVCIAADKPEFEPMLERAGYKRDPDVLDTWFSSALWPLSTMGWPDPQAAAAATGIADFPGLLPAFNPTSVLTTGREIITLWVSRMVMFNRFFNRGAVPFHHVYVHAIIQDGHGQRMSKSLGNGVDPRDIVHSHGADALRFVMCQLATSTQDVRLPVDTVCPHCGHVFTPEWTTASGGAKVAAPVQSCPACSKKMATVFGVTSGQARPGADTPLARNSSSRFDSGRNFCNKLWNASRFTLSTLARAGAGESGDRWASTADKPPLVDRWMLSRLAAAAAHVESALADYQFSGYAQVVYDLLWRDYCDWYIEAIKPTVTADARQAAVLRAALDTILRLLHPVCPFITEEIYAHLRELPAPTVPGVVLEPNDLLCRAGWPRIDAAWRDPAAETTFERWRTLITAIREVRAQHQVSDKRRVTLHAPRSLIDEFGGDTTMIETLAKLDRVTTDPPGAAAPSVIVRFESLELAVSNLADAVDAGAERDRLARRLAELDKSIAALRGRLGNAGYVDRAPAKLVQETRDQLAAAEAEHAELAAALEKLS